MQLNEDFVPSTIDEAIGAIVSGLQPDDIDYIKESKSGSVHFTTGMGLRNGWSLWEQDTPLQLDFKRRFRLFGHGDDMSGIILEGVWAKVRGENVNEVLEKTAERFRKHWIKTGLNPETGEQVGPYPTSYEIDPNDY